MSTPHLAEPDDLPPLCRHLNTMSRHLRDPPHAYLADDAHASPKGQERSEWSETNAMVSCDLILFGLLTDQINAARDAATANDLLGRQEIADKWRGRVRLVEQLLSGVSITVSDPKRSSPA